MEKNIDYKYSLELLEKINSINIRGKNISEHFLFEDYNFWQSSQQNIFSRCKNFSKSKKNNLNKKESIFNKIFLYSSFSFGILYSSISFLAAFIFRKNVLVFSPDKVSGKYKNDKRIEKIYDYLENNNISYLESFHTLFGRDFIKNIFTRFRPAFYSESFCFLKSKKIDDLDIKYEDYFNSKEEIDLAEKVIKEISTEKENLELKINLYKIIFKFLKIKKVLMIDDVRYFAPICIAAEMVGVKTYAFQHGHFTKYHVGWINKTNLDSNKHKVPRPDKLVVWSDYWKKELISLNTYFKENELEVASQNEIEFKTQNKNNDSLGILIPYETDAPKKEIKELILKLKECNSVKVFLKTRPDMSIEKQLKEYDLKEYEDVFVIEDLNKVFERINLVIGTYSTLLYDLIAYDIPISIFKTDSIDYGHGMVKNNLADFVSLDNLCQSVSDISGLKKEIRTERFDRLYNTNQNIEKFLDKII